MTKRILTLPTIALSLFLMLLTACGGGGAVVNTPLSAESKQPESLGNGNNGGGGAGGAGGETDNYPPRPSASPPISDDMIMIELIAATAPSVSLDNNAVVVNLGGVEHSFTGGLDGAGFISDDSDARIHFAGSSESGALDLVGVRKVMAGGHTDIRGTFYRLIPGNPAAGFSQGYGTVGVRTPIADIAGQPATAIYNGRLALQVYQGAATDTQQMPLTMNVDFGARTIGGESTDSTGTIRFEQTDISADTDGGGFNGALILDNAIGEALGISAAEGYYAGYFFGSAATNSAVRDVAGVVQIQGVGRAGQALGIGGFRAKMKPPGF